MDHNDKSHPADSMEFITMSPVLSAHMDVEKSALRETIIEESRDILTPMSHTDSTAYLHLRKNSELYKGMVSSDESLPSMDGHAAAANQSEHRMTFWEGLRLYPKAIGWSAVISFAIVMEGYDTALMNSFYAFPEFQKAYGVQLPNGTYQIEPFWQAVLGNGSTTGSIIGLFVNGILTELFGYRKTMLGALTALSLFIFLSFFAFNIQLLLSAQILCGIAWGIFQTLTTTYAAEVMPLNLRGYLTANVNLCWLLGQITATSVLRALVEVPSEWSYRIPFGLQWFWILICMTGTFFAPESPWWLIRNNRPEEAKKSLLRLTRRGQGFNADNMVALMTHTDEVERKLRGNKQNRFSYLDCFRGPNLRRTEIACMIFVSQNCCGLAMIGFAAYFYKQLGFDLDKSFEITIVMYCISLFGAVIAVGLMKRYGRRILYLCGLAILFCILLAGGIVGCLPETSATLWGEAGLLMALILVFDSTIGPLTYTLVAELPSTRNRVKTVVLARACYNVSGLVVNIVQPRAINPLAWDWRGKTCFLWAGTSIICLVYCFFRLPETKGLSYHELDILFEKRAAARKFKEFQKNLASTGYFSFYDERPEDAKWH